MKIKIYTDGGFRFGNKDTGVYPQGSYGYVILPNDEIVVEGSGLVKWHKQTTQIAEMFAIYESMKFLVDNDFPTKDFSLYIHSDSKYCVNTLNEWYERWSCNGTQIPKGKENVDLWSEIWNLKQQFFFVKMIWVKGHNGNKWNERVDDLNQIALGRTPQKKAIKRTPQERFECNRK